MQGFGQARRLPRRGGLPTHRVVGSADPVLGQGPCLGDLGLDCGKFVVQRLLLQQHLILCRYINTVGPFYTVVVQTTTNQATPHGPGYGARAGSSLSSPVRTRARRPPSPKPDLVPSLPGLPPSMTDGPAPQISGQPCPVRLGMFMNRAVSQKTRQPQHGSGPNHVVAAAGRGQEGGQHPDHCGRSLGVPTPAQAVLREVGSAPTHVIPSASLAPVLSRPNTTAPPPTHPHLHAAP